MRKRNIAKMHLIPLAVILACCNLIVIWGQEKRQTGEVSQRDEVAIILKGQDLSAKAQFSLHTGEQKEGFLKAVIKDFPWAKKNLRSIRIMKARINNSLRSRLIRDLMRGPV